MPSAKAQVAMEFMILLLFIFAVFITFYLGSFEMQQDVRIEKEDTAGRHMLIKVREEILLAQESHNGYERTFTLPEKLNGNYPYNVTVRGTSLRVKTTRTINSMPIPALNVSKSGKNWTLNKEEGSISVLRN